MPAHFSTISSTESRRRTKSRSGCLWQFPTTCPDCGATLVRIPGEAAWYCPNSTGCPTQIQGKIEYYVSRKAMNINIGSATIDLLFRNGLVRNSADLYDLKASDLQQLERLGEKSAQNLIDSIAESKKTPFESVLNALSIRNVVVVMAKKLPNRSSLSRV